MFRMVLISFENTVHYIGNAGEPLIFERKRNREMKKLHVFFKYFFNLKTVNLQGLLFSV